MQETNKDKQTIDSISVAKDVFETEIDTLKLVQSNLDENFAKAIELILKVQGRVVVTGMGKSGHIGAKIAATLASTGTPAFFVHPAEMGHGDLGMLKSDDIVLGLSFSGNTEELRKVLTPIKSLGLQLISITGRLDSALAQFSDVVLQTPITQEACPLDLAPTSSTTAALAMGDALAVTLMKHKNFQKKDFARSHPLGSLGRSFVQVSEIMRDQKLPQLSSQASFEELLEEINSKGMGFTLIVDEDSKLIGSVTDGDLRRAQLKYGPETFEKKVYEIMNKNPKSVDQETFATRAAEVMKEYRISSLIVVDEGTCPVGILDLKDMLAEGFII